MAVGAGGRAGHRWRGFGGRATPPQGPPRLPVGADAGWRRAGPPARRPGVRAGHPLPAAGLLTRPGYAVLIETSSTRNVVGSSKSSVAWRVSTIVWPRNRERSTAAGWK